MDHIKESKTPSATDVEQIMAQAARVLQSDVGDATVTEADLQDASLLAELDEVMSPVPAPVQKEAEESEEEKQKKKEIEETKRAIEGQEQLLSFIAEEGDPAEAKQIKKELVALQRKLVLLTGRGAAPSNDGSGTRAQDNEDDEERAKQLAQIRAMRSKGAVHVQSPSPQQAAAAPSSSQARSPTQENARAAQERDQKRSKAPSGGSSVDPSKTTGVRKEPAAAVGEAVGESMPVAMPQAVQYTPEQIENMRVQRFGVMEKKLKAQIDAWHARALEEKEAGQKQLAVELLRERKQMVEDMRHIITARKTPGALLPKYHIEDRPREKEILNSKLGAHEVEIVVDCASGIVPPSGFKQLDTYVKVSFPVEDQNARTGTVSKSLSPVYGAVFVMNIERGKRAVIRAFERKKLVLEILHSRWLRSDLPVGKVEVDISPLLTVCEVKDEFPILSGRKQTSGTLSVRVRVRTPVGGKKQMERWMDKMLIIDEHFPMPDTPPRVVVAAPAAVQSVSAHEAAAATQATAPAIGQGDGVGTRLVGRTSESVASEAVSSAGGSSPSAAERAGGAAQASHTPQREGQRTGGAGNKATEEEETDYNNVQNLIADSVLEWALALTERDIAAARAAKKPVDDLMMRKQQLEMKAQMLVIRIQTGKLTFEDYTAQLTAKIQEEQSLARKLVAMGKKEEAKLALTRAKLMEKELSEEDEDE